MRVAFATLGCKVNQYDTDAMRELFAHAGHEVVDFEDEADVYIVNTCTVTAVGDKKSRQTVSRAHTRAPGAKIIIAGCYAQRAPEEAAKLPGVTAVAGTNDRAGIVELAERALAGEGTETPAPFQKREAFEELTVAHEGRTRAYLKIQDGCDRFCTYCVIPYARGPVRSRPLEDVLRQSELLANEGFRELVLTGIHLMSYGKDIPGLSLFDAIEAASSPEGIARIRLGSLEPQLLSEEAVESIAQNGKICRQFHLSMQSGSAGVLKRMARRYTPDEYAACVETLRRHMPGCAITTDVIAGFPGETEEEFAETLAFVERMRFARIHVFPYSRRTGTPAAKMPEQIPAGEKKRRAGALIALGERLEEEFLTTLVDSKQEVLFEERYGEYLQGHTGTYALVRAKTEDDSMRGKLKTVYIASLSQGTLYGDII